LARIVKGPSPSGRQSIFGTFPVGERDGRTRRLSARNADPRIPANHTGAITGAFTNQATGGCDIGMPQAMTGFLASSNSGTAISFTVNFVGCDSTTVWTGQLNSANGFQELWLLSLAEPVVWNGVSAGADTFTLTNGDSSKLRGKGGDK
jgi:Avidin family